MCNFSIDIAEAKALEALKNYCGNNTDLFMSYVASVVKEQAADGSLVPSADFAEWYRKRYKGEINFNAGTGVRLRDAIIKYVKENSYSIRATYREDRLNEILSTHGYTSASARILAKRITANFVLDFYHQTEHVLRNNPEKYKQVKERIKQKGTKNYYFAAAISRLNNILAERIAARTKEPIADVKQKLKTENKDYAEKALGGKSMSIQDANLIAVVYEINANPTSFVDEVVLDSRLGDIRFNKDENFDDENEKLAVDEQAALEDENNPEDSNPINDDTDITIAMYDHSGTFTSAMTHVGMGIRSYLNSLKRLNSIVETKAGNPDFDTNNELGIPDTMNADECVTVLYHYGDYSNVDNMIQSIKDIAASIPGFAAFATLAKDLESNYDLAYQFYSTFGKLVISKLETVVEGTKTRTIISNKRSNKLEALGFEFMNSVKSTAINNDVDVELENLEDIRGFLRDTKQYILKDRNNKFRKEAVAKIAAALKRYYPTINEYSVENYINLNKQEDGIADVSSNIGNLVTMLEKTIKAAKETKNEYRTRQIEIGEAARKNRNLKRDADELGVYHAPSEYIDMNPLYAKSYMTSEQEAAALELAKALADYSLVQIEINSVNVHGNQSSDVINNNMLTNVLRTLQNPTALNAFGKYKFQSRQYDFSNIMLEQKDDNGKIIVRGLFRYDENNQLVPTEYAKDLLKIRLFDGASNYDSDEDVLYNEMSQGDYIGTAFINFYLPDTPEYADYFMRTPSDAPRNFAIHAPKYSIKGLFSVANQSEVNVIKLDTRKKIFSKMLVSDAKDWGFNKTPISIYRADQMVRHMTAEDGTISVRIPDSFKKSKDFAEGNTVTVKLQYNPNNKKEDTDIYLVRGIIENGRLVNGTFLGIIENNISESIYNALDETTEKNLERQGKIKYKLNRNHVLFRQFKNLFQQELLNAAVALDKFFVTDETGLVQRYDETEAKAYGETSGEIKWKEGISKDGREVAGAYDNYHHKKGYIVADEVIDQDGHRGYITISDGKEKINWFDGSDDKSRKAVKTNKQTLVGNAFRSDKFVIFDEKGEQERNYGQEIIDTAFDFLYGGSNAMYLHTIKDENGNVIGIDLQPNQTEVIENKIEEFINAYISNALGRLEVVEDFLKGKELNHDTAAEFILNYHLMYNNFNDLFEGDSKFYGTSRDFLKRAKEVQGSGVPYGLVNYETAFDNRRIEVTKSALTGTTFAGRHKVQQFTHFRGLTVVNTIQTNEIALKALKTKLMNDCGLKEKDADRLLRGKDGKHGYQNTKVNDAQSYITFEEWIRRVAARGQLSKYKPLIDRIYAGEPLNVEELSEFIQVQKNFYYDQYYDAASGILVPRQIKNAEFVLVPQLIKGTELEKVATLMDKYGIDQLNTVEASKAGKSDILEVFDSKTGRVKEDVLEESSVFGRRAASATHLFNYNYLYTQQETPQHMNAENKAGIQIMKKILDNIAPDNKFYPVKQRFFELYSANIKDSFLTLMDEFNLETDENGNLVLTEDAYGNKIIKGLNYEVFYQRLKEECARLGLDSNMMDYVTLDENPMFENDGETIMPNYMSMVMQKLENIAQSMFNGRITRQKLPGFHASQVTNVGFHPLSDTVEKVSYSKDLKYHVDDDGNYVDCVEIMLPAAAFGFKRTKEDGTLKTDDELLTELQDEGLDYLVGYRIPTEGKQSVCKMRVVGFVSDAYGSTIIVPNDWVTQTGSDFDIDSVYGITFSTYIDKQGKIKKHQYLQDKRNLYKRYVLSNLTKEEVIQAFEEAKAGDETVKQIKEKNKDKDTRYFDKDNFIAELKDYSKEALFGVLEDIAEEKGLKSYEEYAQGEFVDLNNRNARNNELLRCMLAILGSNEALEENLSRSNFDDITDAVNDIYSRGHMGVVKARRDARSAYNFLDQAAYQEDTMSGAKLKGFSVTRDTFCSICNTLRPDVSKQHQVKVAYSSDIISFEDAVTRYGKENVEKDGNKIIITHNKFGWSNDNKNVVGKILTSYSSQTTAHILDAVKEGSIPNVNDLTFAVYKLFPDLGIDYGTGIAFIMQNGVTRIVDAYNSTKSIYQRDKTDPINAAIKQIAKEMGYDADNYRNIDTLLKQIAKDHAKDFANIFGDEAVITFDDDKLANIIIDGNQLRDALSNPRKGNDGLLFDLGIVLQYSKLSHLGTAVGNLARVTNPDKFGAKQTIYATNKVFEDIVELIGNDNPLPLTVDGGNFLEAIYPGISDGLDAFITSDRKDSKYPPLYNFLKYATGTSIKINRSLFVTQTPDFIEAVKHLESFYSEHGKLTEKQYKDFEKYIIGKLYAKCQSIMRPITYKVEGENGTFVPIALENEDESKQEALFAEERTRVFGYGAEPEVHFDVKDINNPTQEETNAFAKLTPAQKVAWIQGHFKDAGVFSYLRTTLFNERETRKNKAGSQTVEFVDTTINIENIYNEFANSFSSTNPLVALAAYDLVKYAFIVEGYKMKKNGISKMIPNSVLYRDFGVFGTGIVTELQGNMRNISTTISDEELDKICEDYIRSHSLYQIPSIKVQKTRGGVNELSPRHAGIIQIPRTEEGYKLAEKYRVIYREGKKENIRSNSYVKLRFGDNEILYKIKSESTSIYLYPLNKLEENEHGDFSVNMNNNKYAKAEYYEKIIEEFEDNYYEFDINSFREIANKYNVNDYRAKSVSIHKTNHLAEDINLTHPEEDMVGAVDHFLKAVQKHFGDNNSSKPLYHINQGFAKKIKFPGAINGLVKSIIINKDTPNARIIQLAVYKLDKNTIKRCIEPYLGEWGKEKPIKKFHEEFREIIETLRKNNIVNPDYNSIFVVKPYTGEIKLNPEQEHLRASNITEVGVSVYKAINLSYEYDDAAAKAKQRLRDRGITTESGSVSQHVDEVIRTGAEYAATATEKILNNLRYFIQDPNGDGYLSVTDPEVIDAIKEDPELIRKFLQTILEAEKIAKNFRIINELDIKSQDPELQRYLTKIKDCVNDLQNNYLIKNAKELFANNYLAKLSTDLLIQRDILNILDGYNSTNSFSAWVNDLQETTNPLIQVITKQVIGDIHGKEFEATRKVREFHDYIKGLKAKAAAAGKEINWDNIIDEDGRFIQNYMQSLVDDMNSMRDEIASTKANFGEGSVEYLEAQLKYNKWKLEHINQELYDDYYRKRIELDEAMLHGEIELDPFSGMPFDDNRRSGGFPIVFSEYKKLEARRREILSHIVNGNLDEYWKEQLNQVKKDINNLLTPLYRDPISGELLSRESYDNLFNPVTGTEEEKRRKILYSAGSQMAITKYIKAVSELNTEYYGYDVEFGFEEELERNLNIIKSYEKRDANGNIRVPMNILMENEEYVRAKEWVQNNAVFTTTLSADAELTRKLNDAEKLLRKENSRARLRTLAREREAYDNHGTLDGTKFTDADMEAIREEQEKDYNIREEAPFSDRTLISNASPLDELYTPAFYKGMTSNGVSNPAWLAKVHEINELLKPYYDNAAKIVRFDLIPNTEKGRKIYKDLEKLYLQLADIKKTEEGSNGKEIHDFIEKNVEFKYNWDEFNRQEALAKAKGEMYHSEWNRANKEIVDGEWKPNHYLYGYATPKENVRDKFVDKERTNAINLLHKTYMTVPTEYYYQKMEEMRQKGEAAYNEWYNKNHIYNPYTHEYEPLRCWTTREFRDTSSVVGQWEARGNRRNRKPNQKHINPKYKPNVGNALNYKEGTGYDNPNVNKANEFEKELKVELQEILSGLVKTKFGKNYIEKGFLPTRAKGEEHDAKFWGKEILKSIGWVEGHSGKDPFYSGDIDYSNDKTISMPMLGLLKQKDLDKLKSNPPVKKENESDADFEKRVADYKKEVEEQEAANKQAHRDALDRNWEDVIAEFILKAAHFNAVQDNKFMLFYGRSMLENLGVYQRQYGFFGDYKKDYINSDETTTDYIKRKDSNLIGQYENWVRRLVYDQWKEKNAMFTKWASRLQSLTSAQYMMLNVRGGIANVTLGETNIIAEAFAKEYFGTKEWLKGKAYWTAGIPSYFSHMYKDTSSSVADALIKFMNVVDFDELTGKCRIVEDPVSEGFRRTRDAMFSTLTIGENFMQNGAMFSMMMSHRIYEVLDEKTGKRTLRFMNEAEAMRDADMDAMREILGEDKIAHFNEFVETIKKDANQMKDYAWRRKDFVTEYTKQYLTKEEQKAYISKRDALQKVAKEEFYDEAKHPTLISQFTLADDQRLGFKKDSVMAKYDIKKDNGQPSDAYQLLADFRGRVISVNKKIHGIYDRLGQAQLEKTWYGSLVMQYHKHMYPGILKRWRREGFYNEQRGTVEKGSYIALKDFLATPFRKYKAKLEMNDAQVETMEGVQNILSEIIDFCTNLSLNWNLLPEHERANIKRNLGDICGVLSALFMALALRAIADDDDEDGIVFNLALYEADRLASESFQFNPIGMWSEARKLWSTPIAAQSGVQDLIQSAGLLSQMIMQGDDFDPYYHSGRFAGEHKLSVYIQRRIPIWRGIKTGFIDIVESNSYYKMGDNMLGMLPIAHWAEIIRGEDNEDNDLEQNE